MDRRRGKYSFYKNRKGNCVKELISNSKKNTETTLAEDIPNIPDIPATSITESGMMTRLRTLNNQPGEYFTANSKEINTLFNESFKEHTHQNSNCTGDLCLTKTSQMLLATAWRLECSICSYRSLPRFMSPKSNGLLTINMALGFALLKSSIGGIQFREIMLSLGINPGSVKGIQQKVTNCGRILSALAEGNMSRERWMLRSVKQVTVSLDGWYPTKYSTGPWQASSQVAFTVMDSKTNKVLVAHTASKLCPSATRLRNLGQEVDCPNGHPGCTANLDKLATIGQEGHYASEVAKVLQAENINVTEFCSDADSKIKNRFKKIFPNAEHRLDRNHLSRGLKRGLINAKLSDTLFSLKTVKEKRRAKTRFANDFRYRVEAEFKAIFNKTNKDTHCERVSKISHHVDNLIPTLISCFKGNHDLCLKESRICTVAKRWERKHTIHPTKDDEAVLKKIVLDKRLGNSCLEASVTEASTQANEAFNRLLVKTAPKTSTFAVNFRPRILAAVLIHNVGSYACNRMLLNAAHHQVSEEIWDNIKSMEQTRKKQITQKQSNKSKRNRAKLRNYKVKLHDQKFDQCPNEKKSTELEKGNEIEDDDYQTDVLLESMPSTSAQALGK